MSRNPFFIGLFVAISSVANMATAQSDVRAVPEITEVDLGQSGLVLFFIAVASFMAFLVLRKTSVATAARLGHLEHDILAARGEVGNPNRTLEYLRLAGGTPKHSYLPASDSMFFDTGICGLSGMTDEVCDPELLDAYIDAGINLSLVPNSHFFDRTAPQLVRLRFREDHTASHPRPVVETITIEEALSSAMEYLDWSSNKGKRPLNPTC